MVSVPRSLDEVTPMWVEKALRDAGVPVSVTGVDLQQIAVGEGFIGLIGRVTPSYESVVDTAPATLIVKIPSSEPGAQALAGMLRLFEREHRFYTELAPAIAVRVPRCYAAQAGDDGAYALLLEDLDHLDVADQLDGTTRARAESAMDWLAGLHASHWMGVDEPDRLAWIPRPDDQVNAGLQPLAQGNLDAFCDAWADHLGPGHRDLIQRAIETMPDLLNDRSMPFTVGHGDFRLDNMRFDGDDIVVFDWQVILVGDSLYDVMYFLVTSLTTEQRRAWETDLLDRYFATLERGVDHGVSRDELVNAYRRNLRFYCGLLPALTTIDLDVNDRGHAFASAVISRVLAAADDHGIASMQ